MAAAAGIIQRSCSSPPRPTSPRTGNSPSRPPPAGAAWWWRNRRTPPRPASRCSMPAATRSTRRSRPRSRSRRSSRGIPGLAASATRWCIARARRAPRRSISARPRRPRSTRSRFKLTGTVAADLFGWPEVEGDANIHGPLSFVIPSAVAGYAEMHRRWGKLPLAEIAAPAVALARRGLPQDWYTTLKVANSASILRRYPESARIYLRDGLPPVPPYQGGLELFPARQICRTRWSGCAGRLARFLRGRDRGAHRRRREGDGRRALGARTCATARRACRAATRSRRGAAARCNSPAR